MGWRYDGLLVFLFLGSPPSLCSTSELLSLMIFLSGIMCPVVLLGCWRVAAGNLLSFPCRRSVCDAQIPVELPLKWWGPGCFACNGLYPDQTFLASVFLTAL